MPSWWSKTSSATSAFRRTSGRPLSDVAIEAVAEVGNPTILATFAVIAAILPMAFVHGLMGPYMMPIPVGASSAMMFSLLVAFVVSPWASLRLLRHTAGKVHSASREKEDWATGLYRRFMTPMMHSAKWRYLFMPASFSCCWPPCALVPLKLVQVKMLPFDNKSEFQVVIDMPNGTTAGADRARRPGARPISRPAARGDQLSALYRDFRAL